MSDVAITGLGLVCALGDRPSVVHGALCEGRRGYGVSPVLGAVADGYQVGEIPGFVAGQYLGPRNLRPLDRTGQLTAVAAELALADSGWDAEARAARELGLVLGTTFGSARTIGEFDRRAMRDGPDYASPLDFANTVISAPAGQVAIWHGLRGVNSTVSTGAASGLHAIGYAAQLIASGHATAVLAGGAEEVSFEAFLGFQRAGWLLPPGDPAGPRPFDRRRCGCVLGEAAGLLVLEAADLARARGARILGWIRGWGAGFDSRQDMATLDGIHALSAAIARAAGRDVAAIDAVVASAVGHPTLDTREGLAIEAALGARADRVPVTTIAGHVGDTQGGGGALQTIVALESLRVGSVPPVAGLEEPDHRLRLDFVRSASRAVGARQILVTAQAREGNACALVLASN